jgi:hypothetical protein
MTAKKAADGELAPVPRSVALDGLAGVHAAARPEPAVPTQQRGEKQAIALNEEQKQPRSDPHRPG